MSEKRSIEATEIVADIRSGMTHAELMKKYRLSAKGLRSALKKLGEDRPVDSVEVGEGSEPYDDTIIIESRRKLVRNAIATYMAVYERQDLTIHGSVRDITEGGVGIKGIRAAEGETKTFVVTPDEFVEVDPFEFKAICRWVLETPDGDYATGFQITEIAEKDLQELRKMVKLITSV